MRLSRRTALRAVGTSVVGGAVFGGTAAARRSRSGNASAAGRTQTGGWSLQTKLSADDGDSDDFLGRSVALADGGDLLLVGAGGDEGPGGESAGSMHVFERDGSGWTQQARLTADDRDDGDGFGDEVALAEDGDTALVSAYRDEDPNGTRGGSAYVFQRSGDTWSQQAKLVADDGESRDFFGRSVTLADGGDTALVGASGDEGPSDSNVGSVYVFERDGAGWSRTTRLTADDGNAGDFFGFEVAVASESDTLLVSAPNDENPNGTDGGSAYVFERGGSGWAQQAKIAADDGDDEDFFGQSIALADDGDVALVGTVGDENPNGAFGGSAYVFGRDGGSWTQRAKLVAADGREEDDFGWSAALTDGGDTALVGAVRAGDSDTGAVYVYERDGGDWPQRTKLLPDVVDAEDFLGNAVAASDSTAVAGAPGDDEPNGNNSGAAYVFTASTSPLAARFDRTDAGTQGEIEFQEVVSVIRTLNADDPDVGFGDAIAVIRAFNGDGQWDSVDSGQ